MCAEDGVTKVCLEHYEHEETDCTTLKEGHEMDECPISDGGSVLDCTNGGHCFNQSCCCVDGYAVNEVGQCDIVDECDSNPCMNGGTCYDLTNAFACACPGGYYQKYVHEISLWDSLDKTRCNEMPAGEMTVTKYI